MKKFSCAFAVLLLALVMIPVMASAKEKPKASTSEYIRVYALPDSGDSKNRLYGYSDEALTKQTTQWIRVKADSSHDADECRIVKISSNGKAVKISYPLDSGGRSTAWFDRSKFTSFDLTKKYDYQTIDTKTTVYRAPDGKNDYGYAISNNSSDKAYILGMDSSGNYRQIIYKLDSGVWKMAWVKTISEPDPNDFWKAPFAEGYRESQSFGNYYYSSARPDRPYHCGWDIVSDNGKGAAVLAVADGTVKYKGGGRNDGANGLHVIIEHTFNGKTVYSLYSHLDSYSDCPKVGKSVSQGQQIGIMGSTGNSSGPHLHLGIFTGTYLNSPYGYAGTDSSTKMTYKNTTYYNPKTVIDNDKLP